MIEANRRVSMLVGALVLVAGTVLAVILFFVGAGASLFSRNVPLTVCFKDVTGLRPGAAVLISGVRVGAVDGIALGGPCGDEAAVRLGLERRQLGRLHADAEARLITLGLLGDRLVALAPGQATAMLSRDAVLHGVVPADASTVVAEAGEAFDVLLRMVRRFDVALANADIGRILSRVGDATESLRRLLDDAQRGPGPIHALIYDRELARQLHKLGGAVAEVSAAGGEAHQVMAHLDRGARDASDIVAHVKSGQGTIGGLIYDPAIYEDLRAIVGRVRRSVILRALARYVIKHQ